MRAFIDSVAGEYRRYKALADGAMSQVSDADLLVRPRDSTNSITTICRHVAGNLKSRFTDFLTADGEKPWRDREAEFAHLTPARAALLAEWEDGWRVLLSALDGLTDADAFRPVTIRGQSLSVTEALHRSLAHVAYHVGQIVDRAHVLAGTRWKYLSIAPGGTSAYNAKPDREKPADAKARITPQADGA